VVINSEDYEYEAKKDYIYILEAEIDLEIELNRPEYGKVNTLQNIYVSQDTET